MKIEDLKALGNKAAVFQRMPGFEPPKDGVMSERFSEIEGLLPKLIAIAEAAHHVAAGLDFDHNGWQDPDGMWRLQKAVYALETP